MARAENASIPCDLLTDERFTGLKLTDQATYVKLILLSVRDRTACLTGELYGTRFISHTLHIDRRTLRNSIARLAAKRFVTIFDDATIIVEGIEDLNRRLDWKPIPEAYR